MNRQYNWDFNIVLTELENSSTRELASFKKKYQFPVYLLQKSPNILRLTINIFTLIVYALKYNPKIIISSGKHATWFAAAINFFFKKKINFFCPWK